MRYFRAPVSYLNGLRTDPQIVAVGALVGLLVAVLGAAVHQQPPLVQELLAAVLRNHFYTYYTR